MQLHFAKKIGDDRDLMGRGQYDEGICLCKGILVIIHRKLSCADPEVRHSNTEESILYFIRKKYNIF